MVYGCDSGHGLFTLSLLEWNTSQKQLEEERVYFASHCQGQVHSEGVQECEVAGHIVSLHRKQRKMNVDMDFTFFSVVSPRCSHLGRDFLLQVSQI